MSNFVVNYRKMSELEKPVMGDVALRTVIDEISKAYPQLNWEVNVAPDMKVRADAGMLRQVLMNLTKNAVEADARRMVVGAADGFPIGKTAVYFGNDGHPIPAENRQSLFVPFFTTKRSGSGIGLSLSRRMMIQQDGMLELADSPRQGCHVAFVLSLQTC